MCHDSSTCDVPCLCMHGFLPFICALTHACVTHVFDVALPSIRRHEQRAHPQKLRHFHEILNAYACIFSTTLVCAVTHSCVTHVIYVGLSYIRRHEQRAHPQQLRHFGQPRNRLARRHRCLHLAGVPHYLRSVAATYYTATHCNTLQHTATHCHTLPHTATHCHALLHTATHCTTPHHTAISRDAIAASILPDFPITFSLPLQHTATYCKTQPHSAPHYTTLPSRAAPSLPSSLQGFPITVGISMPHICHDSHNSRLARRHRYVRLAGTPHYLWSVDDSHMCHDAFACDATYVCSPFTSTYRARHFTYTNFFCKSRKEKYE